MPNVVTLKQSIMC